MRDIQFTTEYWELRHPFTITGRTFEGVNVLCATISEGGHTGRGEAAGVYYLGESGDSLLDQSRSVVGALADGLGRDALQAHLPPGGLRNAIDCALWDLEAKRAGRSIWELTGLSPQPVITSLTVGIDTIPNMVAVARTLDAKRIKIKLDDEQPLERVCAIREACPHAELIVDINEGWTIDQLIEFAPRMKSLGVAMIEQPLPRHGDAELANYSPPLPLCADESCLDSSEFEQAATRYQMINIKLDKAGGLTEALRLVELATARGIGLMVGNMVGTSLAMAPAFVVAQRCRIADLDGALFLRADRDHAMHCHHGVMEAPARELWG